MQIDSTPFDVGIRLDDDVTGRVELTGLTDVYTRTICAALLRPTTKAVDAALLLAKAMTPEPMRPGWPQAISTADSMWWLTKLVPAGARRHLTADHAAELEGKSHNEAMRWP